MKILVLAPQPFYQERGTPLAVNFLLQALCERGEDVDLLSYHEGDQKPNLPVRHYRIPGLPGLHNVRPGFSWKKILCDLLMLVQSCHLATTNRYNLVHAVEEGVYIAMFLKIFFGLPYIYDMDSSLVEQLLVRYPFLKYCESLLHRFVLLAVRNALIVAPACKSLCDLAHSYGARITAVLPDISLVCLEESQSMPLSKRSGTVFLYAGNLEPYQGIDLMLDAFRLLLQKHSDVSLVIAGGDSARVESYRAKARNMKIAIHTFFLGHRPIAQLPGLLQAADILISPRLSGTNVPMKIHSYVSSGKPIIATKIPAHAEIIDETLSRLCDPTAVSLAEAMAELLVHPVERSILGERAREHYRGKRTYSFLKESVDGLYDSLGPKVPNRSAI